MKSCFKCHTNLPEAAKFCFNCGAQQPAPEAETQTSAEDTDQQAEHLFVKTFFAALRNRINAEHQADQFQRYSERLYDSGFRDTVYLRGMQLAESAREQEEQDEEKTTAMLTEAGLIIEELLDFFIIHHCQDLNEVHLPEAILKYQRLTLEEINLLHLALDYLDFASESETVYTDFLTMPVEKLRNAGKFFLHPEKNERIWLICDQSLFGSCKEGFALTEHAIYWKANLQAARKVAYRDITEVRRERDWIIINDHFFNVNKSINLKMLKLLKKLSMLLT